MKKILLIAIIVLSSILFVKADELPTIEVGSYNAIIGEEITIPVSIKNNVGFTYIGFKIDYDTESLEYVDSKIIGLEEFSLKEIVNNKNNRIVMYAITLSDDNMMKKDTKLAEIRFKVKEKAKTSDLKIDVTDYGTTKNRDIKFQGVSSKVTIVNEVKINDSVQVDKDFDVEDPKDYKWESSDDSIASISEDGKITFKKDGDVTITQKDKDGKVINSKVYKIANNQNKKENKLIYIIIIIVVIIILLALAILSFNFIKKRKIDNR